MADLCILGDYICVAVQSTSREKGYNRPLLSRKRARGRAAPFCPAAPSRVDRLLHKLEQLGQRQPALLGRVAVAQRHRVVFERLEVDGDAEGRADLVVATVAPADGAGRVELDVVAPLQPLVDVACLCKQLGLVLDEGQDRGLDGREPRVELEKRPLLAADLVDGVRRREHGQHQTVHAEGGLDHVRHVPLLGGLVVVLHRLAARLRVLREVVVAARGAALQLLRPERESEHHVRARARVVGQLVGGVDIRREELGPQPDRL
mmetsp:Transcript_35184/g.104341  ORF Transcript_35184/g.104341 Transcript_35184/m.104341 type:complete len:262 (-) Transcript_35184:1114-1899(-)